MISILTSLFSTLHDIKFRVDGGALSSNIASGTFSNVAGSVVNVPSWGQNQILEIVKDLSADLHTVRIFPASIATPSMDIFGFEIINFFLKGLNWTADRRNFLFLKFRNI